MTNAEDEKLKQVNTTTNNQQSTSPIDWHVPCLPAQDLVTQIAID